MQISLSHPPYQLACSQSFGMQGSSNSQALDVVFKMQAGATFQVSHVLLFTGESTPASVTVDIATIHTERIYMRKIPLPLTWFRKEVIAIPQKVCFYWAVQNGNLHVPAEGTKILVFTILSPWHERVLSKLCSLLDQRLMLPLCQSHFATSKQPFVTVWRCLGAMGAPRICTLPGSSPLVCQTQREQKMHVFCRCSTPQNT